MTRFLRWLGIVLATALVAGIVAGLAARVAMRVVALMDDEPGTVLTLGGTLAIVVSSIILDMIVTAVYSAIAMHASGSDSRKGLVLSVALLGFPGLFVVAEAIELGNPLLNVPMFAGVALLNGQAIALTFGRLHRAWPVQRTGQPDAAAQASSSLSGPNTALGM